MIFDTVFGILKAASAVTAIIGTTPCRIYEGDAPQDVTRPYAVFQIVGGAPENYLDSVPGIDQYRIQIDCYADGNTGRTVARNLVVAVRNALEPHMHMIGVPLGPMPDPQTGLYRYMAEFTPWEHR